MAWEHARDYEPGTYGRMMHDIEVKAKALGPAGAGVLARLDQDTARFRHYQQAAIFGTEPPAADTEAHDG
jgi:hypothetical protein